ncbi:lipoprotein [[Haemophilus] ducreyi]|nr:probable lipoprotein NlpC [[Haemophilus] ducreyi]VEG83534.1 lipoprotein [[Haemophilus] ducreyi]
MECFFISKDMRKFNKKIFPLLALLSSVFILSACSNSEYENSASHKIAKSQYISLSDSQAVIRQLTQQQKEWQGTRYRLGGNNKAGVDCSGFMQVTFRRLFNIDLPRTTTDQLKKGNKIARNKIKAGDLVFFKTGRGPNGKHVGVYVKDGKFLHASTKGGVIYSNINSAYWRKAFWQARRL